MKSVSSKFSRMVGRIILLALLILNITNLILGEFVLWIMLLNVIIVGVSFYFMMRRVGHIVIKERIAESLLNMTQLIHDVNSKEELYQRILEEVVHVVDGGEKGSLMRLDEDGLLIFEAVVGFDLEQIKKIELRLEDTFLYRKTNGNIQKSEVVKNISEFNKINLKKKSVDAMINAGVEEIRTTISSPILINGALFGMLNVDSTSVDSGDPSDVALVDYFSTEVSKIIHLYHVFENNIQTAKYDHLTNALSRSNFMNVMEHITTNPNICPEAFALVYCDLDGLKSVNDQFGHEMGDTYLKQFVNCMSKHLKGEEIIARLGGDEFVILLIRDEQHVDAYLKEAKAWLSKNCIGDGEKKICVRYSCGKAIYPIESRNIKELIEIADERMYIQKQSNR